MPDQAACGRCGTAVPPGARHCPTCGADVSGQQGQVATAYVTPDDAARLAQGQSAQLESLRKATLGHYDIHGELGQGGMATVYLAHDIALDRKVAIKVMSPALFSTAGMVERFKREARTAAALSHPHIIPIYAVNESPDLVYFVMKFVEGRSLESIVRAAGPLPLTLVRAVLYQAGEALGYAHRRGVVHRDIKPANIMLDADGWVVVADFGIAKVAETQGLTMTGATIGTPSYMSPEQCEAKRELSGASDQYSLGIVAYELLAGRLPFLADTTIGLLYAQVHEPPQAIAELRPDCPPETAAALMRMLEKDPARRWPDIESAVSALGGAPLGREDPIRGQLAALGQAKADADVRRLATPVSPIPATRGPKPQTTRAATPAPPKQERRVPVVAWAAPLVALAAVAGWFLATRSAQNGKLTTPPPVAFVPAETTPTRATPTPLARPQAAPLVESACRQPEAPPAAVDERAAIEEAAGPLVRALESRNLARLRQVYGTLTVEQAQDWGAFFMSARNPRVTLHVTSLDPRGDRADARLEGSYEYDDIATGRGLSRALAFRASFVRESGGWRLTSLR